MMRCNGLSRLLIPLCSLTFFLKDESYSKAMIKKNTTKTKKKMVKAEKKPLQRLNLEIHILSPTMKTKFAFAQACFLCNLFNWGLVTFKYILSKL